MVTMVTETEVRYLSDEWRGRAEIPRIGDRDSRRANTTRRKVRVYDARPRLAAGAIDLDINGFALLRHRSQVADFQDDGEVRRVYYPEVRALVARRTGADAVFVSHHLVRTEDTRDFNKAYARFLHCDYSQKDARGMAERALAKRADGADYAGAEFAWYNTWQPFDHPASRNPLALVDAASVAEADLRDYEYTGYSAGVAALRGRSSMPAFNAAHRFYYVPNMCTGELLLFKQLDTRRRGGACPHTSFDDPATPPDAPPRRSIEVRLLAAFAGGAAR